MIWSGGRARYAAHDAGSPGGHEHDRVDALASRTDSGRTVRWTRTARAEVQDLLKGTEAAGQGDRQAEVDSEAEDEADAALALTEEGQDDAIAENLRNRLDAIERALRRLDEGTYGRSVRSGEPIP